MELFTSSEVASVKLLMTGAEHIICKRKAITFPLSTEFSWVEFVGSNVASSPFIKTVSICSGVELLGFLALSSTERTVTGALKYKRIGISILSPIPKHQFPVAVPLISGFDSKNPFI